MKILKLKNRAVGAGSPDVLNDRQWRGRRVIDWFGK